MEGKILVVTHKPYWMPDDSLYLPIQVGFAEGLGITRDNTGDNIAAKNANYCELTALYWAWKNFPCDFLGLSHYRRHFAGSARGQAKRQRILREEAARALLEKKPVWLPKPRHYWIETNASHYAHAHHAEDLAATRAVLQEKYPAYLDAYDTCMNRTWGHRFNMFLMRRDMLDAYCAWLFDILFALEARLDISQYSANDARVFGFVSERLLDVWLLFENVDYGQLPVMFMEKENWLKKGARFLGRKFLGEKRHI